ncbi:MAG TPA: asparagine synthase (glutamine-hydrolyzing), partial [Planctomycetes bacterium]|nr:asparagine synthase (glutamine-hydrolyzing) [Planctomycetota bacterium]
MFAFALWDRRERRLALARDRLGIKPLYWLRRAKGVAFASELKALRALEGWTPALDPEALLAYLRLQYVPAPRTIYQGVSKLEPGTLLWVEEGLARPRRYWQLGAPGSGEWTTRAEALQRCEELLSDSVRRRLAADVPVGVFLSGGVDSSLVAALGQRVSPTPLRTFSIGFQSEADDEAPYARAVAEHLGCEHTELYMQSGDALALVERLGDLYDEPFADSSQLPTALLSQLTRSSVTVALAGDGGDELFAGYTRYRDCLELLAKVQRLPAPLRELARAARLRTRWAPDWGRGRGARRRLRRATLRDLREVYLHLTSLWEEPHELVEGAAASALACSPALRELPARPPADDPLAPLQRADLLGYLPDDLLTKVDRASMAASLEVRLPLLDHRLVELAWSLPSEWARRWEEPNKPLLRDLLARHVPRRLTDRPKRGFRVPVEDWLRGPLRSQCEHHFAPARLEQAGLRAG